MPIEWEVPPPVTPSPFDGDTLSGLHFAWYSDHAKAAQTAPLAGLATQTLESGGGRLFASANMLREAVLRLACDEPLRLRLGNELKAYLENVVSWDVVARQYGQAYAAAHEAKLCGSTVDLSQAY